MRKNITLALRIQFGGQYGLRVSNTSQAHIFSLAPWLRTILSDLRLPHPKQSNIVKPTTNSTGVIDMYWDVETGNVVMMGVVNRCKEVMTSSLKERSIIRLMVFVLPPNMRDIPGEILPAVVKHGLVDVPPNIIRFGTSNSRRTPTELEIALLAVFHRIGLSLPTQVEDLAPYIPMLTDHIQMLHDTAEREFAARLKAEATLAEEHARFTRILQDVQMECREPFIVPALLDAFVALSETVETVSESQTN